jgi:hypothetical protein
MKPDISQFWVSNFFFTCVVAGRNSANSSASESLYACISRAGKNTTSRSLYGFLRVAKIMVIMDSATRLINRWISRSRISRLAQSFRTISHCDAFQRNLHRETILHLTWLDYRTWLGASSCGWLFMCQSLLASLCVLFKARLPARPTSRRERGLLFALLQGYAMSLDPTLTQIAWAGCVWAVMYTMLIRIIRVLIHVNFARLIARLSCKRHIALLAKKRTQTDPETDNRFDRFIKMDKQSLKQEIGYS